MATSLREAFKKIIKEAIDEVNLLTGSSDPEDGTVIALNNDKDTVPKDVLGTVSVQTSSNLYTTVGTPVPLTLGAQVLVITADGKKVAIPR